MYNTNNYYNAKEELASLPENYTIEIALENNDVLGTPTGITYNTDRLREFICNLRHGIPDKVRITKFGIDGPPNIAILEYNGKNIKYTSDVSRLRGTEKFIEFYGTNVIAKPTMSRLVGLTDTFYIVTKEHGLVPIISDHSKILFSL